MSADPCAHDRLLGWAGDQPEDDRRTARIAQRLREAVRDLDARRLAVQHLAGQTPTPMRHRPPPISHKTVRAWARERGIPCPPQGVVPRPIIEQWQAEQDRHEETG